MEDQTFNSHQISKIIARIPKLQPLTVPYQIYSHGYQKHQKESTRGIRLSAPALAKAFWMTRFAAAAYWELYAIQAEEPRSSIFNACTEVRYRPMWRRPTRVTPLRRLQLLPDRPCSSAVTASSAGSGCSPNTPAEEVGPERRQEEGGEERRPDRNAAWKAVGEEEEGRPAAGDEGGRHGRHGATARLATRRTRCSSRV